MMTGEKAIELGRRAVAAGFRPMPGMYDRYGWRALRVSVASGNVLRVDTGDYGEIIWREGNADVIPDFRDPATLGILRQQVVALVPGAVELSFAMWMLPVKGEVRQALWMDRECLCSKAYDLPGPFTPYTDNWPIEALVACLEAAKDGKL